MKTTTLLKTLAALALAALPTTVSAQSGGSLTPPPGEPEAGMKTLDEVEARTAISTVPYTISKSGSYYLTKNLIAFGDAIIINASNVTLDLNGFTLTGEGSAGINAQQPLKNICVTNGVITGFQNAISFHSVSNSSITKIKCSDSFDAGIYLVDCIGNTVSNCSIANTQRDGILFESCSGNTLNECVITTSGDNGISWRHSGGNTLSDCSVSGSHNNGIYLAGHGQESGNTLSGCSISASGADGVRLEQNGGNTLSKCIVTTSGQDGIYLQDSGGNTLRDCSVSGSHNNGIYLAGYGEESGNTLSGCSISASGGDGIRLEWSSGNTLDKCVITASRQDGISLQDSSANRLSRCSVSNSQGTGVYIRGNFFDGGNTLSGCSVLNSGNSGILIEESENCNITSNTVQSVGHYGIMLVSRFCRIEGNSVSGAGTGICSIAGENLVVKNTCLVLGRGFTLDPSDIYGPVVSKRGALDPFGESAHPWANFSLQE